MVNATKIREANGRSASGVTGRSLRFIEDRTEPLLALALLTPALCLLLAMFVYPLLSSIASAFTVVEEGRLRLGLGNFYNAIDLYLRDIIFSIVIVTTSTLLIGIISVTIGGYLILGTTPWAVSILRWLYRIPLFVPFIVAAQCMRTFLAQNGLMNNALVELGVLDTMSAQSFLDWRGIVITFVWKQTPFVALLVAGAMASLDRNTIDAGRNIGASRLRVLIEIVVPQVARTLFVGLVLSWVIIMSVLSVPMMISSSSPTLMTVNMAFRINAYGDYATANALGVISYLITAVVAWFYLKHGAGAGRR